MSETNLITDLMQIQTLAVAQRDAFEVMFYTLQIRDDLSDAEIDALAETAAVPIINAIDCTQCANCCRNLHVYLVPEDIPNLAAAVDIPPDAVETRYVDHERAEAVGEWGCFRSRPCTFLAEDKRCSIYLKRPQSCRDYPVFTPDFRWTMDDLIEGAAACPIIYNTLVAMIERVDRLP